MSAAPAFALPPALEATAPPEARGVARDGVRLMVATRSTGAIEDAVFHDLPRFLDPGDLLVVNTSATVNAAIDARLEDATLVELRFSGAAPPHHAAARRSRDPAPPHDSAARRSRDPAPPHDSAARRSRDAARPHDAIARHAGAAAPPPHSGHQWLVELRVAGGSEPFRGAQPGERLALPGGAVVELHAPYAGSPRLWRATVAGDPALARDGRPVRYGYVPDAWPLDAYQTAFALHPGSAEMPSAARPFTPQLVTRLVSGGVLVAPLVLHTGLSSPEIGEPPLPEWFAVPQHTARVVNAVRGWGGRVIAVGTTAVRALETVAAPGGTVSAGGGFTELVITPERGLRAIDALITGWHEPQATHLELLEAAAGPELLARSYDRALRDRYLWHEFGDAHLILP